DIKLRQFMTEQFNQKGYSVSNDHPFTGGYITPHYGQNPRVESMQIELAYHMYIENRYFGEEELSGVDVGTFTTAKNSLQNILSYCECTHINSGQFTTAKNSLQNIFMELLNYILSK